MADKTNLEGGGGHWSRSTAGLRAGLSAHLPLDDVALLHRIRPWRHFSVALRQVALLALLAWGCFALVHPPLWIPLALLQGVVLFDFTVLLHEVLHRLVWPRSMAGSLPYGLLAWAYALPSGISPSQFTRWHLDHHAQLGTADLDPKRHRLSPRTNARWLKVLYFTPALFFIYFRAAARETATYSPELKSRIARERATTLFLHFALALALLWALGAFALIRVYLVPYLFGFPLAFGLNRLGQHYDIDPAKPSRWGTRMRRSILWDLAFLNSGYHLEHHYFPGVPLYNLPRLNLILRPFYEAEGIPERSYGWLIWRYIALNRAPHTRWE